MNRSAWLTGLAGLTLAAAFASVLAGIPAAAQTPQDEPRVRDLTRGPLDERTLIETLTPKDEGLRPRDINPPPPNCVFYRDKMSRGITVKPAADIVAVKILFAFNSADLTPAATGDLDTLGRALSSSGLAPCCFRIEGHTDNVGTEEYNRDLSVRRARSVAGYLSRKFGIQETRLLVAGLGKSQPIADNSSEAGRQTNRRVQIVNLGYGQVEP
jgi:outer membrane protein OmpA-like peptidoglycan-associated protein